MRAAAALSAVLAVCAWAWGQTIEDWVESSADPQELQTWLDDLQTRPFDLNAANAGEIAQLPLMNAEKAEAVVASRRRHGPFESFGDLFARVPLNPEQRSSLGQFAMIGVPESLHGRARAYAAAGGDDDVRPAEVWSRTRGDFDSRTGTRGFVYSRRDAGSTEVFDLASAGVELPGTRLTPRILLGDFQCESGTGLVFASAYGMANWVTSPQVIGPGEARGLAARPSSAQLSVLRGAALDFAHAGVEACVLGSVCRLDAALSDSGTEGVTEGESSSEELARARRDQVEERLLGFVVQRGRGDFAAGMTGYRADYDPPFARNSTEEILDFSGRELRVGSLFARGGFRGAEISSELAASDPGGVAHQTGLAWHDERAAIALYHVEAAADFHSPRSKLWGGFGEEAANERVTGARFGLMWLRHQLSVSAATGRTPFHTGSSSLPRRDADLELRWRSTLDGPVNLALLLGRRWREETSESNPAVGVKVDRARTDVLIRVCDSPLEYRLRAELRSAARDDRGSQALGTLLFVQAKWMAGGTTIFGRVTTFSLESSDVAVQLYENALRGTYPLAPFSGRGSRASLIVSRQWRSLRLAAKAALTRRSETQSDEHDAELGLEIGYASP